MMPVIQRDNVRTQLPAPVTARSTVAELCAALGDIASRRNLPGRGTVGAARRPYPVGTNGGKTRRGALSPELLRALVAAIPNDTGHFDDRKDWVRLLAAIKGAALAGGCEAVALEVALEVSARWPCGDDPAETRRVYDSIDPRADMDTLWRIAEHVAEPKEYARLKAEEARLAFAEEAAQTTQTLSSATISPVAFFDPTRLTPRQWLYGRSVIRGFVSVLVAPGGTGKSALALVEAVAMVTGRELLPGEKPTRSLVVWYHNAEDGMDELLRRLAAVMKHYNITHAELAGRLILTSGRDLHLRLARMGRDGPAIVPGAVEGIVAAAQDHKVDVLVFDPLGAMHSLPENSNEAMNLLAGALREIADMTGAAVILVHHTSKVAASDMDAAGAGAARGASALTDFARIVRQVVPMTQPEAAKLGVAENDRRSFMRVENGKANLAPAERARWLRLLSVSLNNGTADYPHGDEVVVVERWTPPATMPGTPSDLAAVQRAIAAAPTPPRFDHRSTDWVGLLVARELGLDIGAGFSAKDRSASQAAAFARVKHMVECWMRDGSLARREVKDPVSRKPRLCVSIGSRSEPSEIPETPDEGAAS